jgi:tetratricopeptide (TPR) repeat protein
MHIPELANSNDLKLSTLIFPLLYSYLSSVIYIRYQNIPLLIVIHILSDIPIVFLENSNNTYIIAGFILMASLLMKQIFNSLIRKINSQKAGRIELSIAVLLPLLTFGVSFSKRSEVDYYNLSKESRRLKDFESALEYANKSITDSEQNQEYFFNRAIINHSNGNHQLALDDYNKAISINQNYYLAIRNRGFLANDIGEYQLCIQDLTVAIDNSLESADVFLDLGTCNLELGLTKLAFENFEKSRQLDNTNEKLYYEFGRAYLKVVNFDSVVSNSRKAIEINAEFAQAYELGAFGYTGLEIYDSSNLLLYKTVELKRASKIRDFLFGVNYYHLEELDSSIKYLEKSISTNSTNPKAYYLLSNAYYELGDFEKTCENLFKAAELGHELAKQELNEFCGKGP